MLDAGLISESCWILSIKDFYDIWILSKQIDFDDNRLIAAILATFKKRQTIIPSESVIFTDAFFTDSNKQQQWLAFCRKRDIKNAPDTFAEVANHTCKFLKPLLAKAKHVQQSPGNDKKFSRNSFIA